MTTNMDTVATDSVTPQVHVRNNHISEMNLDVLFHIGLTCSLEKRQEVANTFGDVKFFVTGGCAERMTNFAHSVAMAMGIPTPYGYALSPIGSTSRYMLYKVGPVLVASHSIGMPPISILLHEVTKLLEYAGARNTTYIRMGTSGGIGVEPGTVVITSEGVNNQMESVDEVAVLGFTELRSSICSTKVRGETISAAKEVGLQSRISALIAISSTFQRTPSFLLFL